MLDDILIIENRVVGKQKVGLLGFEFVGWLGGNLSDGGIQVVGSSWAKKMIFEIEKWWCEVVLKFVHMYYHFVNDLSLCAE